MPPKYYHPKRSTTHKKNHNNNHNKRSEDDPPKAPTVSDDAKNPDSSSASVTATITTATSLQRQHNQPVVFNPYHNSFVSHFRRQLKKAAVLDSSEEAQRITSSDDNTIAPSTRLEKQLQDIKDLVHVPDPEPFLVCCVVNSIHNLRVVVDPKNNNKETKKRQNNKTGTRNYENDDVVDDDDDNEEEDEEDDDEFFYSEDPRVWDYSIWDCPRSVLISGKQRLYKFQQKCRERQKLWEEYREKGETLANAAATKRNLKMLKRKKKEDKESKKKKSSEKAKNNSGEDDEEDDAKKTKNNKFVTVSSWTSIPAPPVISANDQQKPLEVSSKNSTSDKHPPPKKIAISALPSCYLSVFDKDVNPLATQMAKDKNAEAEEISLAYRATTGVAQSSAADSANEEKNNYHDSSSSSSKNNNNPGHHHQIKNNKNDNPEKTQQERPAASLLVDRPPSRVTFDPARYTKIVAQTAFETPHPALVDMAVIFNNKIEISCMLTAPTMYHDMPSNAESHAMHEAEAEYVRNVPSTMTVLERNLSASAIPSFPSAAKLREYAAGALGELKSMVKTFGDAVAVKNYKEVTDEGNEVEESKEFSQKQAQMLSKNKRKHYAGLLKLHFAPVPIEKKNENGYKTDDDEEEENNGRRSSPSSPSISSAPEYSSNSNEATAAGSMILENHQLQDSALLLSKDRAFTLVHCLGPVKFLPPVDSALFVPRAPTSFSLVICEVPDPEMHPAEKILLKYLLEFLEGDEFNGSLATTFAQNFIRDTPQFDFVIGDIHDCWGSFINTHANIEFATFSYSDEEVELLGVALSKQQQQANNKNKNKNSASTDGQQDQNNNNNHNNNERMEHPSQNFEHMAKSFALTKELRLVAWKNVHTFMEGDYARWATKMENERRVVDVMQSLLTVRPYEHHELIKLLGQNRAFISLASPCVRRMVEYARTDPRYVILHNRLHPLTIEIREDLVEVTKREYFERQRRLEVERRRRQNGAGGNGNDNNNDDDDDDELEDLSTTEGKLKALRRAMDMETYD